MSHSLYRVAGSVALILLLSACSHSAPPAAAVPEIGVVIAQPQTVPLTRNFVGRLSAYRSADVRARVAGVLLKRDYQEGSEVKAGQLLFQIDPAPLKAALANAEAGLAQAEAAYTNARVNAQRAQSLAPEGYISRTDLDNAEAAARTTRAQVQAARAQVQTARINLGYASVTAPIAGRAGEQQVTEGALVGNGSDTLLTTIDQIDPLYVNFTISVGELDQLRQAQQGGGVQLRQMNKATVKVTLQDGTVYPQTGSVDFSSVNVNPATGAVNLRALLPNPAHTLLPGTFVTLTVGLGERHNAYLVPQAAVQRDTAGTYVFVVGKDGKVARRNVTTAGTHGVDWVVTHGLDKGDAVVVSGIQVVHPGGTAKAVPWQPAAPPASAMTAGAPAAAATAK
ncbi:MAG: efflux RND transporter periplasmic adaptor subunit [Rhodanobacteraceae bacterium]|nr:MAG: efflux RND transporter periplasmic adaptor subunit [Rhodanobacteraceae bacterium]